MDKQTKKDIKTLAQLKRYKDEQGLNGEQIAQTIEVNEAIEDKIEILRALKKKIRYTNMTTLIALFILIVILLYTVISVIVSKPKPPEPQPEPMPIHIAQETDYLVSVSGSPINKSSLTSYTSQKLLEMARSNPQFEITCNEFTKISSEKEVYFSDLSDEVLYYSYDEAFKLLNGVKPEVTIKSFSHRDDFKSNMQYIVGNYKWGYLKDYSCQFKTSDRWWLGFSDKSFKTIIANNQANIEKSISEDVLIFSSNEEVDIREILSGVVPPTNYVVSGGDNEITPQDYFNNIKLALASDSRLIEGSNKDMNYIYYIGLDYTLADEIYTMYLLGM